jgi:hypothetical protein
MAMPSAGWISRAGGGRCLVIAALASLASACDRTPPAQTTNGAAHLDPASAEFRAATQARLQKMEEAERISEHASWFGRTGLSDADERELPRYLRREFGRLPGEPGALRADDLAYLGVFVQDGETVHYWRIDHPMGQGQYAYVVTAPPGHEVMGWSGRTPPH